MNKYKCVVCNINIKGLSKYNMCQSCSQKNRFKNPENNPNWKNGISLIIHKCIDCGISVSYKAKRCLKCNGKIRSQLFLGENNPMFGKKRPKHSKFMRKNNPIFKSKISSYMWKGNTYNNIWMRSQWEIWTAQWLDLSNIKWLYESQTFDLGNTTYTPDFYLPEFDCYIEIKGWETKEYKKKIQLLYKNHPKINIQIWKKEELQMKGIPIR